MRYIRIVPVLFVMAAASAQATPLEPGQRKVLYDATYKNCMTGLKNDPRFPELVKKLGRDISHPYCDCSSKEMVQAISLEDVMAAGTSGGLPPAVREKVQPAAQKCMISAIGAKTL